MIYMKKVTLIILITLLILTGCSNKEITKVYLSDEYYKDSKFISIAANEVDSLKDDTYLLYTYNNYCTLEVPCEDIFNSFMSLYNISIKSIPFDEYKKTSFYKKVKYAPTVILISKEKIITYLDANNDNDLDKYQDITAFTEWLNTYIYLTK